MNANLWTQLLIAIIPALITSVGSLIIVLKNVRMELIHLKLTINMK